MKRTRGIIVIVLGLSLTIGCSDDGKNGLNSLVDLVEEPVGDNCESGGVKIISGLDANENGVLDEDEIQSTEYVCNGESGGLNNTELIQFPGGGGSSHTIEGNVYEIFAIKNFTITDYPNIDSIAFHVYLMTDSITNHGIAELYDITNGAPIMNTEVLSNAQDFEWVSTNINFLEDFPEGTIDLGVRVRTETEGILAGYYFPVLALFRD